MFAQPVGGSGRTPPPGPRTKHSPAVVRRVLKVLQPKRVPQVARACHARLGAGWSATVLGQERGQRSILQPGRHSGLSRTVLGLCSAAAL